MSFITLVGDATRRLGRLIVRPASAHCDTEEGPAVTDGRKALATGNINLALKWVDAEAEAELRPLFDKVRRVRQLGTEAAELADRFFLETLVRLHRAGEGVGFDGIKPTGTKLPPQVVAADLALEQVTIDPLRGLIPDDRWAELEHRFERALAKKDFDPDDLDAARDYIAAYVTFFKYAEGEEHEHHPGHGHHEHPHAH